MYTLALQRVHNRVQELNSVVDFGMVCVLLFLSHGSVILIVLHQLPELLAAWAQCSGFEGGLKERIFGVKVTTGFSSLLESTATHRTGLNSVTWSSGLLIEPRSCPRAYYPT